MSTRLHPGQTVYAKDGKSYVVEAVEGGTVYCASINGAEMEFPESGLATEAEWAARADGRRDASYTKLRQSRVYTTAARKLDPDLCHQLLTKAENVSPGLIDFAAYITAQRILVENKDTELAATLSIVKARNIFDAAKPEVRAGLLATVLSTGADSLVNAAKLGDNLMRALVEKGLAAHGQAFEDFIDRPRK